MGRSKKKPDYNKDKLMDELLDNVVSAYEGLDKNLREELLLCW